MTVYKVILPRIGRDSAMNYPLSHLMLHVLGIRTPSRLQFLFSDNLYVTVTNLFISRTRHPPVTRYVRTIMLSTVFSRLVQEYSSNPDYSKVLLGTLIEDARAVLGAGDQTTNEKIALLKTLDRLTRIDFDNYQRIMNQEIFSNRLYAAGM